MALYQSGAGLGALVGVGTTNPTSNLQVYGTPIAAGNVFSVLNTAASGNVAQFSSSSGTALIINANGNVGIGKTNPGTLLDVNGALTATTISGTTLTASTAHNTSGSGVYQVAGTTVVDSSRNLTNIGTIGSGAITSSSTISGTTITGTTDASFNSVTVGIGSGSVATNTAIGKYALLNNTTGSLNTAVGESAMYTNSTGLQNTALGARAMYYNTGSTNTAVGDQAMYNNIDGVSGTAVGNQALYTNTSGQYNTAIGQRALFLTSTGGFNTALGERSMYNNTTGVNNTAVGQYAIQNNITGNNNTAIGKDAGPATSALTNTTCIGYNASASASNSVILGNGANVGIGTASPIKTLDVYGGIRCAVNGSTTSAEDNNNSVIAYAPGGITGYASIWMGYDPTNDCGYINSARSGQIRPVCLQTRGGNVGIGTTNPGALLDVQGGSIRVHNAGSSTSTIEFKRSSDNWNPATIQQQYNTGAYGGDLAFQLHPADGVSGTAPVTVMYLKAGGNVGIGMTSPGYLLDVAASMRLNGNYTYVGGNGGSASGSWAFDHIDTSSTFKSIIFGYANSGGNAAEIGFNYVGSSSGSNYVNIGFYGFRPLTVTYGGCVGIGTTSPVGKLTVGTNGDAESMAVGAWNDRYFCVGQSVSSYSSAVAIGFNNTTNTGWIYSLAPSTGWRNFAYGAANHYFYCASVNPTLSIVGANVGIGTTSPSYALDVQSGLLHINDRANGMAIFLRDAPWDHLHLWVDGTYSYIDAGGAEDGIVFRVNGGGSTYPASSYTTSARVGAGGQFYTYQDTLLAQSSAGPVTYIGLNKSGVMCKFNDDMWFGDPQSGAIQVLNGAGAQWGTLQGYFTNMSTRASKKNVTMFDQTKLESLYQDTIKTKVCSWHYKEEADYIPLKYGPILDDSPPYFTVTPDGESLYINQYVAMLHGALQVAIQKIESLEARVSSLENNSS